VLFVFLAHIYKHDLCQKTNYLAGLIGVKAKYPDQEQQSQDKTEDL
jgi:hypothetical protein